MIFFLIIFNFTWNFLHINLKLVYVWNELSMRHKNILYIYIKIL